MSYVQEVLQPGEIVRFRTNVHWFVYLKALMAAVIGLAFFVWYWRDGTQNLRLGTEIAVTDRRIIHKTGLIQRNTPEISMEKVESVDVAQSVLGRIFGFGDVTVRGTGEGTNPLRKVAGPIELRNAVMVR